MLVIVFNYINLARKLGWIKAVRIRPKQKLRPWTTPRPNSFTILRFFHLIFIKSKALLIVITKPRRSVNNKLAFVFLNHIHNLLELLLTQVTRVLHDAAPTTSQLEVGDF